LAGANAAGIRAQARKEGTDLKREVTLYNPYKPALPDVKKKSYLPEINDTVMVNPSFSYEVVTTPFLPVYSISPIKAASLMSDPLPKLYKSYVKAGLGSNNTPFLELRFITPKEGAIGLYASIIRLTAGFLWEQAMMAGFMDNDAHFLARILQKKSP
jgi:hypothetical protein